VSTIIVSSAGAGYGFFVDDQGRLHQAGFGPEIDAHMQRLPDRIPPALYPLAYPAYDEEPTRAPPLRVTHSDGTTTTQPKVEDVRVVGSRTDILLVDPDCSLEVTLSFCAEDHGVLRQWASITNRQSGVVTLHEVAAASPLLASPAPYLTHFGGGDWAAEWTTTTEALTPGTKVVESRGGVQPHLRSCPFFLLAPNGPPEESGCTVLAGALAWVETSVSPSSGRRPLHSGSGADTIRRRPSTCSTQMPPSPPPSRSGCGRPKEWAPSRAASTAGSAPTPCATATNCGRSW
jgi:hypothetical protein